MAVSERKVISNPFFYRYNLINFFLLGRSGVVWGALEGERLGPLYKRMSLFFLNGAVKPKADKQKAEIFASQKFEEHIHLEFWVSTWKIQRKKKIRQLRIGLNNGWSGDYRVLFQHFPCKLVERAQCREIEKASLANLKSWYNCCFATRRQNDDPISITEMHPQGPWLGIRVARYVCIYK